LQNQGPLDEINHYEGLLDNVTPGDVKTMAGKYLSGENYIRLVLMPEKITN
jgi:zinc protease